MKSVVVISGQEIEHHHPYTLDSEISIKKINHILTKRIHGNRVFEIGFGAGHLSRLILELMKDDPDFRLHSIDICEEPYVEKIAIALQRKDPRFTFQKYDSSEYPSEDLKPYDLLIIDGGKDEDSVRNDLLLGMEAKVKYMLVFDYDFEPDEEGNRIGAAVGSFVGDIDHKYTFFGPHLHIERNSKTIAVRLLVAYKAQKNHTRNEIQMMKKQ